MQLDRTERRVIGSLIEKRWSTPDQYPLTLNALVAACNQKSNRNPVLSLEGFEITGCLLGLREKGLVLIRDRDGGRVDRYAERMTDDLSLDPLSSAIVAELLVRGPQTAPELGRRCVRMVPDANMSRVEERLADLARTRLVMVMARQAGQRHPRWADLLSAEETVPEEAPDEAPGEVPDEAAEKPVPVPRPAESVPTPPPPRPDLWEELRALRGEVAELRRRVERLEESGSGAG